MKTKHLILSALALIASLVLQAQDIAVQTPSNTTVIYHDINQALYNAPAGSTVFLPAGSFTVSDTILIKKKLTIVGVGHRSDTPGGNTMINGNIFLDSDVDDSSLMGVYLSGDLILSNNSPINGFTLRYCNLNNIVIKDTSNNIIINQNYIRGKLDGNYSSCLITNNVIYSIVKVSNGIITNNFILTNTGDYGNYLRSYYACFHEVKNSSIKNNIVGGYGTDVPGYYSTFFGFADESNLIFNNIIANRSAGINPIVISTWEEVFTNYKGISVESDFHLKSNIGKNAGTDGTDIGIYGGTGFSDTALPPYPQITFKNIPGQTDEYGNLKIQVKVRAQ